MSRKIQDITSIANELKWSVNDECNVIKFVKSSGLNTGIGFSIEIELYGVYGEDEDYISEFIINALRNRLDNFEKSSDIYMYGDFDGIRTDDLMSDIETMKSLLKNLCDKLGLL